MGFIQFIKSRAAKPTPASSHSAPPAAAAAASASISTMASDATPTRDAEARAVAELAAIVDPQDLARWVTDGSTSRVRQLAAQRIEDHGVLKHLLKQTRGKDKSVYKIIKDKCDALREKALHQAHVASDIQSLCDALERHATRSYDVLFPTSLKLFEERWHTLQPHADSGARTRAVEAIERCHRVMVEHSQQLAQHAAAHERAAAMQAERSAASMQAAEEIRLRDEASAAAAATAANTAVLQAAELAAERAAQLAADAHAARQLGGLIAKAHGALRDGQTGRAAGLRRAIQAKLGTLQSVPPFLSGQVIELDSKLDELREWKDYAVAPKRAELIMEMEALIGAPETPQALAERIKLLQADWQTVSKGVLTDSEADWQRFHQAAVKAYQPCRDYFAAQAQLRQNNLAKRREVLERLYAFEALQAASLTPPVADAPVIDWRDLRAVLREAPQEWRRHFPVDRTAAAELQSAYEAVLHRLQMRLDEAYEHHAAGKTALIEQARELLSRDGRDAVESAKRLQLRWQRIGPAPHGREPVLWDEFRKHCDAVHLRRLQADTEHSAALATRKALQIQQARDREDALTHLLEAARLIQAYGWTNMQGADAPVRESAKQAAQAYIDGVSGWPTGGSDAVREAWANADAANTPGLTLAADNETALRRLCIRCEILTGHPTPPQDHALRRDYQMQRLVRKLGGADVASPGEDNLDALALEWTRAGPLSPDVRDALAQRFVSCQRSRSR